MPANDTNLPKKPRRTSQGPTKTQQHIALVGRLFLHLWPVFLILFIVIAGGWLFSTFYYQKNRVFTVDPKDIKVIGDATVLTPEMLASMFSITAPTNALDLVRSDITDRLRHDFPLIKDAKLTFTTTRGLEMYITERMPIARLTGTTLSVDEDGMIFRYPRSVKELPEIGGFDIGEGAEPGVALPPRLGCMLHLLQATQKNEHKLPGLIRNVRLVGNDPEDGILIVLSDDRRITIAWPGMERETEIDPAMLDRLGQVRQALQSPLAEGRKHFNATAPKRVSASE